MNLIVEFVLFEYMIVGKVKEFEISKQDIQEFRNLARHNKRNVMYKKVRINLNGFPYELMIKGVGKQSIKLELYLDLGI